LVVVVLVVVLKACMYFLQNRLPITLHTKVAHPRTEGMNQSD